MMDTIQDQMKKAIVDSKGLSLEANPFYWWSQLDYGRETSHPEYSVLEEKVKSDLEVLYKAQQIMRDYEKIGVRDIREPFVWDLGIVFNFNESQLSQNPIK